MDKLTQIENTVSDLLQQLEWYREMFDANEGGHIEYTAYEIDKCIKITDDLHSMLLRLKHLEQTN